ncbi:ABC transporter permease [Sediminispirochaeta smaragdinae]|uniref:ABC-2 type transporter n=1 Tax=Sediminispirochaeta smaragdinae (strain DSM 11293 / JCM 15392 / SEBR 4228) TaxID=573413 RepID=E1R2H6_SEDSS|nr:ABC transporter permease [Sediminispirochaeta smaragdinae]ADK82536.1 ABC-2 type transporter [Sediminispirochaeta smaragdinae DSM 11293]
MRRIIAVVRKEFRQIRRTKAYIGIIFIAPFMQLLIMGSAITNEVKHIPSAVLDLDRSPHSREVIEAFKAVNLFDYLGEVQSRLEATAEMDDGRLKLVLVIPRHFERDLSRGIRPGIQVLIDGVDGNSAGITLGYINSVLAKVQHDWALHTAGQGAASINLIPRMLYNPNLDSTLNFVPGLIGILLVMMTTMLTALNIVREKEIGTLEQLMVTPLEGWQLIIGKIIPFTVLGFLQFTIGVLAARIIFAIPLRGSLPLLYAMVGLFFLSTMGLGIFVSTITQTQQQAMFVAYFIIIFMLLLSGFFVPIQNMPIFVQYLTLINPLRYFINVLREIYLKATPFRYLWREAAAMGGIGLTLLIGAALRFHKRLG